MFRNIAKIVCLGLVAVALLLLIASLSLKLYPQAGLWLVGKTTGHQVTARKIDLELWPLSIKLGELAVINPQGQAYAYLQNASFDANWLDAVRGRNNFWSATLDEGSIDLSLAGTIGVSEPKRSAEVDPPLQVHNLLSSLRCKISDVRLTMDEDLYLYIDKFDTRLNKNDLTDSRLVTQTIAVELIYGNQLQSVEIKGIVHSSFESGTTKLYLQLAPTNLTQLLADTVSSESQVSVESALDWSWLNSIQAMQVRGTVAKIVLGPNEVSELDFDLLLDDKIVLNRIDGKLKWQISEQILFDDLISIEGALQPSPVNSAGADLGVTLSVSTGAGNAILHGNMNINGLAGNDLQLKLKLANLPFKITAQADQPSMAELAKQYLPMTLSSEFKTGYSDIEVNRLQLTAGQSDLNARIRVVGAMHQTPIINAELSSSLISYELPSAAVNDIASRDDNKIQNTASSVSAVEPGKDAGEPNTPDTAGSLTTTNVASSIKDTEGALTGEAEGSSITEAEGSSITEAEGSSIAEADGSIDNGAKPDVKPLEALTTANAKGVEDTTNLFSDEPIDWGWLNMAHIDATLSIEKFKYQHSEISNIKLPIVLKDGELQIENLVAGISGGNLSGNFSLRDNRVVGASNLPVDTATDTEPDTADAVEHKAEEEQQPSLDLVLQASLRDARLESAGLFSDGEVVGGISNASIDVTSSGTTIKQLVTAMSGELFVEVGEAQLPVSSFNIIGGDLLSEMVGALNPLAEPDQTSKIGCAVINAKLGDGKVLFADSLVVETDKMAVVGDGHLDLVKEQVDLSFNPRAQSGLGVNAGTLVKFMKLGGHLSNPGLEVSAAGLLKTGVAVGAAISTGGVSLLADGLLNKMPAGAACKKASKAFGRETN